MDKKYITFIEGRHSPELREELPEIIRVNRKDGTIIGLYSVDGYYQTQNEIIPVRLKREYDVKTERDALKMANKDGLVQGIMIEQYISELEPCALSKINFSKINL